MAYEMVVAIEPTHLHVILTGTDSLVAAREYWTRIAARLREVPQHKVLMEERLGGHVPDGEIHEWGEFMRSVGLPPGLRIAFAYVPGRVEEYRYVETLLVNRGFVCRIFDGVDDARAWLLSEGLP